MNLISDGSSGKNSVGMSFNKVMQTRVCAQSTYETSYLVDIRILSIPSLQDW